MAKKKRFGVSIDIALAEKLDSIAKSMSIDRSRLVEKALSEFVKEHSHSVQDHRCCGVMVAETTGCDTINKVVELYRDIIMSYTHNHIEKRCICIAVVVGNSHRVRDLHKDLMISSHRARYIPIAHE